MWQYIILWWQNNINDMGLMEGRVHNLKMKRERLYVIWAAMKHRCHTTGKDKVTKWYRDKGISVCDEWRYSYANFRKWAMENGYEDGLTIDRMDADGNYEPENCHWITRSENSMKRSPEYWRKRKIAETIDKALQYMSQYDRGYFAGYAKGMLAAQENKEDCMTEVEKGALTIIEEAMPHMTEYDRGTFVGFAKGLLSAQEQRRKEAEQNDLLDDAGPENTAESEENPGA